MSKVLVVRYDAQELYHVPEECKTQNQPEERKSSNKNSSRYKRQKGKAVIILNVVRQN
jgi:hypothetical protein